MSRHLSTAIGLASVLFIGTQDATAQTTTTDTFQFASGINVPSGGSNSEYLIYFKSSIFNPKNVWGAAVVEHTVDGAPEDEDLSFTWSLGGSEFSGELPCCENVKRTNLFTTYKALEQGTGQATLEGKTSGLTASGQANYVKEVDEIGFLDLFQLHPLEVLKLTSDITGSPTKIRFTSEVEKISDNLYEYRNQVENFTDYDIEFNWGLAGLVGTVEAFDTVNDEAGLIMNSILSSNSPTELSGSASALLTLGMKEECGVNGDGQYACKDVPNSGNEFVVIANVLAPSPVPLPAAAWLFFSAIGGLVIIKRKRS